MDVPAENTNWPTGQPPFTTRTVKSLTPDWLCNLVSLPTDTRVLALHTALQSLFTSPSARLIIASRIPLPSIIYGNAHIPPIRTRITYINTGSIRGATTTAGQINLVLCDETKIDLMDAYETFLGSFAMAYVQDGMKDVFRQNFRAALDNAGWRVGIDVMKACAPDGSANLKKYYKLFPKTDGISPKGRGRPKKLQEGERPGGLRRMIEGAVGEIRSFFVPSLPGPKGVKVSMWRIKWRVPDGGNGVGRPGSPQQLRVRHRPGGNIGANDNEAKGTNDINATKATKSTNNANDDFDETEEEVLNNEMTALSNSDETGEEVFNDTIRVKSISNGPRASIFGSPDTAIASEKFSKIADKSPSIDCDAVKSTLRGPDTTPTPDKTRSTALNTDSPPAKKQKISFGRDTDICEVPVTASDFPIGDGEQPVNRFLEKFACDRL